MSATQFPRPSREAAARPSLAILSAWQLAYLLYTLCERKGLAEDARVYNELATAWNDIVTSSIENAKPVLKQAVLDLWWR